jgi:hypothetical protein
VAHVDEQPDLLGPGEPLLGEDAEDLPERVLVVVAEERVVAGL